MTGVLLSAPSFNVVVVVLLPVYVAADVYLPPPLQDGPPCGMSVDGFRAMVPGEVVVVVSCWCFLRGSGGQSSSFFFVVWSNHRDEDALPPPVLAFNRRVQ